MSEEAHPDLRIAVEQPNRPDILALLHMHLEEMHRYSPSCKVNALPATKLAGQGVTFFAARGGDDLAAIGALKRIDAERCEIKSMRASADWRGKGAGKAMLDHLLDTARARGCTWVGLETGRHPVFEPATKLYSSRGFAECEAFEDYESDDFSMCMSLELK
ncbi:GNAT family N-acetyltransferase [Aurantiacibacter sp. D1-12]|uniref:GNAT family N-acetyltransferase n=1 Tax=Aurantiacibacter sp. D1-12 TaxID=2993658 RepID=UPI00237C7832|nr:GNAT family N-acetyltransferase [Aurantiacibacter sp. D1-12]MDE1467182.1 GNAT family N-acetyltransferase [Aurantiacibacter sp. D1-12]